MKISIIRLWSTYVRRIRITRSRVYVARIIAMFLAVLLSILLAYLYAWPRAQQDIQLPRTIQLTNQQLDTTLMQKLLQNRAERIRRISPSFSIFSHLFIK